MEATINNLKNNFTEILDENNNIVKSFENLNAKIIILKNLFSEFIKNNNQNIFLFGLDSFRFQSRLIDLEYDDMKRLHSAICNRIYCEYYKLHRLVNEYVRENITENKILDLVKVDSFVQYKDLEPFKVYDFQMTHDIHENILLVLSSLNGYIQGREHELKNYNEKKEMGLNIDNFVFTFNYSIVIVREKLTLFVNYVDFFHRLHYKYLRRFTRKIHLMIEELNNDIIFEEKIKPRQGFANVVKNVLSNKEKIKNIEVIEPVKEEPYYNQVTVEDEKIEIDNYLSDENVDETILSIEETLKENLIDNLENNNDNDNDTDSETDAKNYIDLVEFGKSNSMLLKEEDDEKKKQNYTEDTYEIQKNVNTETDCKLGENIKEENHVEIINNSDSHFNIDEHQNLQNNENENENANVDNSN